MITERMIQALGAALSRKDWHAAEVAYAHLRDAEFEARTKAIASSPIDRKNATVEVKITNLDEMIAKLRAEQSTFQCSARKQGSAGGNDPADCGWPTCGCDKQATKVIAALQESGTLPGPGAAPLKAREDWAHKLLGAFCACYAEAYPANTCEIERDKLAAWIVEHPVPGWAVLSSTEPASPAPKPNPLQPRDCRWPECHCRDSCNHLAKTL